jgi:Fic family protein
MAGRQYLKSHPWLQFQRIDLRRATTDTWIMLGEARSKVEHLRGVPLRPEAQKRLQIVYLAKGAWATTSIEGNTLTEDEVLARVQGHLTLPPSREYLGTEIDNVVQAVNQISADLTISPDQTITSGKIQDWNRMVLKGLDLEAGVSPGEWRTHSVAAGPYKAAPAEEVEYLIEKLCDWLNNDLSVDGAEPEMRLIHVIVKAVAAHVYLEWIHPFGDGNGRTGRLLEFDVLVSCGVPFPAAHLLSNHYNLTRSAYYRELNAASASGGDLMPFLRYAIEGLVDGLRGQVDAVQQEQLEVVWENHIHKTLPGVKEAAHRQRVLVRCLSQEAGSIPWSGMMRFHPEVVEAYEGRTTRTLSRDIAVLVERGLIESADGGYRACERSMLAFLTGRGVDA